MTIYLDYNATTPVLPEVVEAMLPYFTENFANPSSAHQAGREARDRIDDARISIALSLGATKDEVIFTGGGTEANNLAILGFVDSIRKTDPGRKIHLILSSIEHKAVRGPMEYLRDHAGINISFLPVNEKGVIDLDLVKDMICEDTCLISVMLANNEIGTIQPVAEIAEIAHESGIAVHVDAIQCVGKIPVKVRKLGADMLSIAAHKFHGPKGIGALYVKRGTPLNPIMYGAPHERGMRPGTQNVPSIIGMQKAMQIAIRDMEKNATHETLLCDLIRKNLVENLQDLRFHGDGATLLPNTVNVSFKGVQGTLLAAKLDTLGICVGTGAACNTGSTGGSAVMQAMRVPPEFAFGNIRISFGPEVTKLDTLKASQLIIQTVNEMRSE